MDCFIRTIPERAYPAMPPASHWYPQGAGTELSYPWWGLTPSRAWPHRLLVRYSQLVLMADPGLWCQVQWPHEDRQSAAYVMRLAAARAWSRELKQSTERAQ